MYYARSADKNATYCVITQERTTNYNKINIYISKKTCAYNK